MRNKRIIMKPYRKTYIEITNVCDLSCSFCPATTRAPVQMSRDLFAAVLRNIQGYAGLLHFHVMGEPLLHPDVGEFLRLCEPYGYLVNLVTNGVHLKERAADIYTGRVLKQISISMQCCVDQNMDINKYVKDIFSGLRIIKKGADAGLPVSLRLWNSDIDDQKEKTQELIAAVEKENDLEKVFINHAQRFKWPIQQKGVYNTQGSCYGLRDQIAILADGTVVPCCLDNDAKMPLGSCADTTLEEVIASERSQSMLKAAEKRLFSEELCRQCSYWCRNITNLFIIAWLLDIMPPACELIEAVRWLT